MWPFDNELDTHDEAVLGAVSKEDGEVLAADLPGFDEPRKRNGRVPDWVSRESDGDVVLNEMDPAGPLSDHDRKQRNDLLAYTRSRDNVEYERHTYDEEWNVLW